MLVDRRPVGDGLGTGRHTDVLVQPGQAPVAGDPQGRGLPARTDEGWCDADTHQRRGECRV